MGPERLCILCETVHASKQEMEEHMRSMLHHRELEKLKGRDCGHECRVCKVTVVSLTDYASHISSPVHKQNVEATEQRRAANEDYFDQALVDLIEKRKEQIRKDKEDAAAKLKKEEEERKRKEEFQQRLKETKDRLRLECGWQQPSRGFGGQHNTWYGSNRYNARSGDPRPWYNNQPGKSATWHAQEPPNFQRWASDEFTHDSFCGGWNNRQWNQGRFSGNQHCRLPWLSSGGSNYGVYGQNNISQFSQRGRSMNFMGQNPSHPPPNSFLNRPFNQTGNDQRGQQGDRKQNCEEQTAESDHKSNKFSKTFGSNPKLDKTCRWSPYPVTKGFETVLHKDTNPISNVPKAKKPDKTPESTALNRLSHLEQKPAALPSSGQTVKEKEMHKTNPQELKPLDGSSSSSCSSSCSNAQKEGYQTSASASSSHKAEKLLLSKEKKTSSLSGLNTAAPLMKVSSSGPTQSKLTPKQSGLSSNAPSVGPLKTRQQLQLPEACKARQTALEKRGSLENSSNKKEMSLHIVEKQQKDFPQSHIGVNKENSCRQNAAKQNLSVRPEKPLLHFSDSSQFLQSLQVSTSTVESSEISSRKEEENSKRVDKKRSCSLDTDEAMQAVEAGQSSESDTSRGGGEAQSVSGSSANLSKLDLPSVLKRDLTKHISSKSKTGGHEPNLNIARRVRNLSESRRSDSEKESGLKPTVRQLISSSGSRRSVNWEQVYQEVRKKQDKGKGMPRFGIEMVPNEQEDQSQEEDDIPLLEGAHWESLIGASAPGATRKRSLSESSLAPESTPSLLTSLMSKEMVQRESLSSEQQSSAVFTHAIKEVRCKQEADCILDQCEAKPQKQPDKLTSVTVKAIQRSSVLRDSSSGTEQLDGQGTGKRRRAAGDIQSAETSGLEHNNKRRKVRTKKERLQIDQLLAVSLREEELSRSLQTVDTSLIQARAALEAAYMEVQRLMVAKQQVTVEMSSLRNKRIELLKGMQGSVEDTPQVKLKEEKMDATDADQSTASSIMLSTAVDTAAAPAAAAPSVNPPAQPPSPPPSSPPFMSVVIKEEPQSPVYVSSQLDAVDNMTHCAHSTSLELPVTAAAASPPDSALNVQPSPERNPELYQSNTEHTLEKLRETADCKESPSGLVEATETDIPTTRSCLTPVTDSKTSKLLSPSRRGSELGSAAEATATMFTVPSVLTVPASPPDLSNGKRVRKLKKRKVLKKAQGTEQPESSDTEIDGEPSRPRWLRPRHRSSGGSQVSTSILPAEDREADMNGGNSEEAHKQLPPTIKLEEADHDSSKHTVNLPSSAPTELTENVDSEESMEVTAAGQLLHTGAVPPDFSRPEPQSLACNEVTSTSDMDICRSSESDMPFAITLPNPLKISSDASSDHGGDELATEGMFDGHQEAVNALQIHNGLLYTCSGDRTVKAFDLVSRKCVAVFEGHSSKVSCLVVSVAPCLIHRLYSGSSDQTIRCYSLKTQECEQQFSLSDRVLCLHNRWRTLYAGLANGTVVTFNLKTNKQMDVFECHGPRAVSCLASSQEGARRILLVGSYDNTISVRDARNGLLLRTLQGHTKTVLCMKVVNDLVFSGSSDHAIYTHNIHTGELVRIYKGHSHAVTVVAILGKVMVTACLDKLVRVYDLQSHEQLQVYGGHKDMVMCMAVHKSMIYTGCYDGSVQAVKLNLMQNHRCWWHGCSLLFGVREHLQQHLINEHTSAHSTALKCRWKNCEEFFCLRNSFKQTMLLHMCKHAEETDLEP